MIRPSAPPHGHFDPSGCSEMFGNPNGENCSELVRDPQRSRTAREFPEVRYTLATLNTGSAQGKIYASIYVRLVDRIERTRSVDVMGAVLRERERLAQHAHVASARVLAQVVSGIGFLGGAAFTHYLLFPWMWKFFASFATDAASS